MHTEPLSTWTRKAQTCRWLSAGVFFLTAAVFSYYFADRRFSLAEWPPCSLEAMMQGAANTPFQYRLLVPWIIKWADAHFLPIPGVGSARGLAFLFELTATFMLATAFWLYMGHFIASPPGRTLLSFSVFFVLPFNYLLTPLWPFWLAYDVPSVMFFGLGVLLLYRRQWLLYYLMFPVATLNRETTCFLTLIYLFTAWKRDPLWKIAAHCGAQFVIWTAIKIPLYVVYASNPGGEAGKYYLFSNLRALIDNPAYIPVFLSSLAFIWLPVCAYWPLIPDRFVRRACLVAPVFLLGMVVKANLPEIRIYGEMLPVLLPAFLLILVRVMRPGDGPPDSAAPAEAGPP